VEIEFSPDFVEDSADAIVTVVPPRASVAVAE
jgi:hypothetical protein